MTTVILTGAEHLIKYTSSHKFFAANSHLGYVTITKETLANVNSQVYNSLVEISPEPTIYLYVPGHA